MVHHLFGIVIALEGVQLLAGPHLVIKALTKVAMLHAPHHHEVFHPMVDVQIPGVHLHMVLIGYLTLHLLQSYYILLCFDVSIYLSD